MVLSVMERIVLLKLSSTDLQGAFNPSLTPTVVNNDDLPNFLEGTYFPESQDSLHETQAPRCRDADDRESLSVNVQIAGAIIFYIDSLIDLRKCMFIVYTFFLNFAHLRNCVKPYNIFCPFLGSPGATN